MRGYAADAGAAMATVILACRHRVTGYLADHPQALPGFSTRCPTCDTLRPIWLVVGVRTAPGSVGSEHSGHASRHKILVFDNEDDFQGQLQCEATIRR